MIVLMRCVAEAVVAKGARGLAEFVPGGPYLFDVTDDALRRLRQQRQQAEALDEFRAAAEATFEEARLAAERIVREVAPAASAEDQLALELYLSQIPNAVRRSLRRPGDTLGRTVPADLVLATPDDLLRRLPPQMPRFRPGDPLPGRPGWTLREPLGVGGFGEVWRAAHEFIPGARAVKFCTDPAARQRLLAHEGKLVARVMAEGRHPNVVPLTDAHLDSNAPWLAYEYVDGGELGPMLLAWQNIPVEARVARAFDVLRVLAVTVGHFHRLTPPIVHRDLKPSNVLIGERGALKVTDFGIGGVAAARDPSGSRDGAPGYTRAVSLLAGAYTPLYASPQQQRGEKPDPRDDVHALGVIGYQMLTGRLDQAPGPRFDRDLLATGVPAALIELIGDCVDPDPARRPADGAALAARLPSRGALPAPTPLKRPELPKPPATYPLAKSPRPAPAVVRSSQVVFLVGVASALGVAFLFVTFYLVFKRSGDVATHYPPQPTPTEGHNLAMRGGVNDDPIGDPPGGWPLVDIPREQAPRLALRGHKSLVSGGLWFTPDGKRAVTADQGDTVIVWNLERGQPAHTLRVPGEVKYQWPIDLSPDGTRVVASGRARTTGAHAAVWEVSTGVEVGRATLAVNGWGRFAPDGKRLVTAGGGKAIVWDAATGQESLKPLVGSTYVRTAPDRGSVELETITAARFSPDGRWVLTNGNDKSAAVWDAATGAMKFKLDTQVESVAVAEYSRDGSRIVVAGADQPTVSVWTETGGLVCRVDAGRTTRRLAELSPNGTRLLTTGENGRVSLWDATNGRLLHRLHAPDGLATCTAVRFNPDGSRVVTATPARAVVWDATSGRPRRVFETGGGAGDAVFSPDGRQLLTTAPDHAVLLWDVGGN